MNDVFKRALPFAGVLVVGVVIGRLTNDSARLRQPAAQVSNQGVVAIDTSSRPANGPRASVVLPTSVNPEEDRGVDQALRDVLNLPSRLRRQRALCDWVLGLSPEEVASAVASLDQLPGDDREQLLPMLMAHWAESDPVAAIASLTTLRKVVYLSQKSGAIRAVFETWITSDPNAATAWVSGLSPSRDQALTRKCFAETFAKHDPAATLKFLNSGTHSDSDSFAYLDLFRAWAEKDPGAAAAQVLQVQSQDQRSMAIQGLVRVWAESNPSGALAWAEQIPEMGVRNNALSTLYGMWAATDPAGALYRLNAMPPEKRTWGIVNSVIGEVALRDIQTAKSAAEQLPEGALRDDAIATVVHIWADFDPAAAAAYTEQLPPGKARVSAAEKVVRNWANQNPTEALAWVPKILSGDALDSALREIGERWADQAPRAAADYFINYPEVPGLLDNVIGNWAQADPRAAATWAGNLPEGDSRVASLFRVADSWAKEEVVECARWLEKLPAGRSRDQAVSGFVQSAAIVDPEGGVSWAATISDPQIKSATLESLFSTWSLNDADAAREWLSKTQLLGTQVKARLLKNQ